MTIAKNGNNGNGVKGTLNGNGLKSAGNGNGLKGASNGNGLPLPWLDGLSDQFQHLRTSLTHRGTRGGRVVVISSCNPREGASTVALNFAAVASKDAGSRVLLVDANLRSPVLHDQFGVSRGNGVVDIVENCCDDIDAVRTPAGRLFSFLPAGARSDNPALVFESERFSILVAKLREAFGLVIFDAAPLIPYPDTPLLAKHADNVVLVLEYERTKWEVARIAQAKLSSAKAPLTGAVLNKKKYHIPDSIYRIV